MKTFTVFLCILCIAIPGFSTFAHAALQNNGGGLIYDTDLNITWYDYTKSQAHWPDQVAWAAGLTVGGVTGWRLPSTVDGPYTNPFDYTGTTTAGYNITTSEMGHLYYTELGNIAFYDVNGGHHPGEDGLVHQSFFTGLQAVCYWSSTLYATGPGQAWTFDFVNGLQRPYQGC
jgi:hypothetical protein